MRKPEFSPSSSKDSRNHLNVAYELQHSGDVDQVYPLNDHDEEEDFNDQYVELEDSGTVTTAAGIPNTTPPDATAAVQEMHLALLYLLSHPEEWERVLPSSSSESPRTSSALQQWNEEESLYTTNAPPEREELHDPLPYAVFCDDAEVVLPQAHTASQLFGLETITGMELEAAAGIPAIAALTLRWLALMPGGDHLNLVGDPPMTVMRIAGGRYRVTAAHRVVWTWMNEFAPLVVPGHPSTAIHHSTTTTEASKKPTITTGGLHTLQVGDLVALTIVDVFESDHSGKLLSYCPTFDNRAVVKIDRTAHALRKQSVQVQTMLAQVHSRATAWSHSAAAMAQQVHQRVSDAVQKQRSKPRPETLLRPQPEVDSSPMDTPASPPRTESALTAHSSMYHGDDDLERHEV